MVKLVKAVGEEIHFAGTKEAQAIYAELLKDIKKNQSLMK